MNKSLLILGAGGHGRCIAELAIQLDQYAQIAFLDDSWQGETCRNAKIIGRIDSLKDHKIFTHAVVGIGNNSVRKILHQRLVAEGFELATLVHPAAWVSPSAQLGRGCVIFAGVVIGPAARIGDGAIVNCNATVDHDGMIEDFAHLGVGVQLAGECHIGQGAFVQAGSSGGFRAFAEPYNTYIPGSTLKSRA
ncbi:acetyltransferase [Dryocola sp. BD586]|uniref:acetyltransferase n=1 Tax=Dryocola sp. BD586 TaxID=3133271 RepID=UPI003F50AE0A